MKRDRSASQELGLKMNNESVPGKPDIAITSEMARAGFEALYVCDLDCPDHEGRREICERVFTAMRLVEMASSPTTTNNEIG